MTDICAMDPAEHRAVVSLLARTFHDDPGMTIVEPDTARRDAEVIEAFRTTGTIHLAWAMRRDPRPRP